jgi:hypothetical protein
MFIDVIYEILKKIGIGFKSCNYSGLSYESTKICII